MKVERLIVLVLSASSQVQSIHEDDMRDGYALAVKFLDKHGALGLEAFDHVFVMDDGVAHIDRRPVFFERQFHDLDRAVHAGAESARGAEQNVEVRPFFHGRRDAFAAPASQVLLQPGEGMGNMQLLV